MRPVSAPLVTGTVSGMADPNGSERSARGARATLLWGAALVLSLGSTAVLVLGDDPRLLRLALVAALWAAFLAAFAVIRLRQRVADDDERAAQRQRVYELELEREIAARREFELEAENEARRRAAEESGRDIEALRAELRTLREVLQPLVGGDFLYERVALQAESTRVRPVSEESARGNGEQVGAEQHRTVAGAARPAQRPGPPTNPGRAPAPGPARTDPPATGAGAAGPPSRPDLTPALRSRPDLPRPGARPPAPGRPAAARPPKAQPAGAQPTQSQPTQSQPTGDQPSAAGRAPAGDDDQVQEGSGAAWTSQVAPGAHAEGTSVVDLIAAYGDSGDSRRRRRRGE